MIFGMPRALFPEMAHTDFGGPDEGGLAFALLFAAIPAGAVLGGIFSGWVSRISRQGLAVVIAILVWGLAMAFFGVFVGFANGSGGRSEEHTSELQSLMRTSYAVFCLKKKKPKLMNK